MRRLVVVEQRGQAAADATFTRMRGSAL